MLSSHTISFSTARPAVSPQSGKLSPNVTDHAANPPDQFSVIVQRARQVLSRSQRGLTPKASTNTGQNTNIAHMEKTIGDLADLVEHTFDPVWKENYRIALVRSLAAVEKAKEGVTAVEAHGAAIAAAGGAPDTFSHPAVGIVHGLDVSSFSARQAGYQQRFNAPPPALPPPLLPIDELAAGNQYNQLDIPGQGTTAIPTQTNGRGYFFQGPRGAKPIGTSHK